VRDSCGVVSPHQPDEHVTDDLDEYPDGGLDDAEWEVEELHYGIGA
jgi:hypothetical protein